MSGSGGDRDDRPSPSVAIRPNAGGGGGGGTGGGDPCAIFQQAPLNSPNPAVVPGLAVGDVLTVVLSTTGTRNVLEVHTPTGGVAGALTHNGHMAIVGCIQAGRHYEADVITKSGGAVTLQVRPR